MLNDVAGGVGVLGVDGKRDLIGCCKADKNWYYLKMIRDNLRQTGRILRQDECELSLNRHQGTKKMAEARSKGGDLFIVDNSDSDWKVRNYLHEWADIASRFDIATGYFEIGVLLALDGKWNKIVRWMKLLISGLICEEPLDQLTVIGEEAADE